MDKQIEERIRQRAYELWMQNGCLPNRSEEYWYQAEQEILGDAASQTASGAGGEDAGNIDSAPVTGGDELTSEDTGQASMDLSPSPLGMTSQTADEALPGTDEGLSAPAASKTRKRRSPAASKAAEGGGESTGEPPKRRRTPRTP